MRSSTDIQVVLRGRAGGAEALLGVSTRGRCRRRKTGPAVEVGEARTPQPGNAVSPRYIHVGARPHCTEARLGQQHRTCAPAAVLSPHARRTRSLGGMNDGSSLEELAREVAPPTPNSATGQGYSREEARMLNKISAFEEQCWDEAEDEWEVG